MSDNTTIFRWSGEYFGFIRNGHFFNADSNYLGWVESDGSVWNEDGTYLGEVREENYILRNSMKGEPKPKIPKIPPIPPIPPKPNIDKIGKIKKTGWEDALDSFQGEEGA